MKNRPSQGPIARIRPPAGPAPVRQRSMQLCRLGGCGVRPTRTNGPPGGCESVGAPVAGPRTPVRRCGGPTPRTPPAPLPHLVMTAPRTRTCFAAPPCLMQTPLPLTTHAGQKVPSVRWRHLSESQVLTGYGVTRAGVHGVGRTEHTTGVPLPRLGPAHRCARASRSAAAVFRP